jgi:predicted transcriptional regulator
MTTIGLRLDPELEEAIRALTSDGRTRNSVIREAVLHAYRESVREELRRETAMLAADPDDRAEALAIMADGRARPGGSR